MRRVIKIGGSLLVRDSLASSLDAFVDELPPAETFAIVGGGEVIDAVRRLDGIHPLDSSRVHWHCVRLLQTSFLWLSEQLPRWDAILSEKQFGSAVAGSPGSGELRRRLLSVESFYHPSESPPLPEDWSTTTDAIAGWLAILCRADELLLLKSCDADPESSLERWAAEGIVDEAIVGLGDRLPRCRIVNFAARMDR